MTFLLLRIKCTVTLFKPLKHPIFFILVILKYSKLKEIGLSFAGGIFLIFDLGWFVHQGPVPTWRLAQKCLESVTVTLSVGESVQLGIEPGSLGWEPNALTTLLRNSPFKRDSKSLNIVRRLIQRLTILRHIAHNGGNLTPSWNKQWKCSLGTMYSMLPRIVFLFHPKVQ